MADNAVPQLKGLDDKEESGGASARVRTSDGNAQSMSRRQGPR